MNGGTEDCHQCLTCLLPDMSCDDVTHKVVGSKAARLTPGVRALKSDAGPEKPPVLREPRRRILVVSTVRLVSA